MDYTEQRERDYQNQIIALFRDKLQYTYLGNFQYARGAKKNSFGKENSPLIEDEMRLFLKSQLNSNDNKQYTEMQIVEAVRQLRSTLRLPDGRPGTLVDINTDVYKLLIHGVKAKPSPDETERDVMFIDFVNTSNNRLCIAEEVSYIDPLTGSHSRPDLVVYINGIAVAVIELKRSLVSIEEAIKQQLSNQCDLIPSFFTTAQFTIAASDTNGFQYATINTPKDFWCAYKRDTNKTGVVLTDQEAFSEFFEKEQFLTFLRYGVLTDGGVKKVMRPHQFHALRAVIPRLKEKESGVIWHSQGSGKSLTMVWIAEYIRANFEDPRVLVITDRTELDKQIASNFTNAGNMLHRATSQEDLLNNLQSGTEWLICSLIHKFGRHKSGDKEVVGADNITIPLERYLRELKEMIASRYGRNFKAKGKNIFVFIDECHRTQGGRLHEAMRAIMGQDVMLIGFTGTPLLKKDKSSRYESFRNLTETRFGTFIHKYLLKQAVEDKVILDLQYENRDVDQQITDKTKLDQKLDEITSGLSDDRRKAVEDRWATLERIYSSTDRIERIGYSILDDMSNGILCNSWCNAMLVAGNIECAYKYYDFFQNRSTDTSLRGRCAVVTSYNPTDYDLRKATSNPVIEAAEKFKYSMAKQSFSDKNRLREQDIRKIVDAWRNRLDIPHFSRQVLFSEIEKNEYNLNIPRYIEAKDTEETQDIDGHLNGGISSAELDALEYWASFEGLRKKLFKTLRKGYSVLTKSEADVFDTIMNDASVKSNRQEVFELHTEWEKKAVVLLNKPGTNARKLIDELSSLIIDTYADLSIVDKYDAYGVLMNYAMETMQDDLYAICADGWLAAQAIEITKRTKTTLEWDGLLIPKILLEHKFYPADIESLTRLSEQSEKIQSQIDSYVEESSENEEDPLSEIKDDDEIVSDAECKKQLKILRSKSGREADVKAIEQYLKLRDSLSKANKAVRDATKILDAQVMERYKTLTESEIKELLIDRKWLPAIHSGIVDLYENIMQKFSASIVSLHKRYSETLSEIEAEVANSQKEVHEVLKEMGFNWKEFI